MANASGNNSAGFDVGQSSRVTRLGKILRKSKIDELPQLLNVLVGDMSIVGPRPEVMYWTQIYREEWAIVHTVRPGISDWAAIKYRNEEELLAMSTDPEIAYRDVVLPKKLSLYLDYVENVSLKNDLTILLSTITSVFSRS